MMSAWFFAALASPLLWAFTNVADAGIRQNYVRSDLAMTWYVALVRLPIAILIIAILANHDIWTLDSLYMLLAGLAWTAPIMFYFRAIKSEDPSNIALLVQMLPIYTLLIAFILLDEILSTTQLTAFVFILVGGGLAALKRLGQKWHFSSAFWWITLANVMWATSDVLFKMLETRFENFWIAFALYFLGGTLLVFLIPLLPNRKNLIFRHFKGIPLKIWGLMTFSNLMGFSGSLTFAYALTLGKASLTAVMLGFQALFAFIFGLFLYKIFPGMPRETLKKDKILIKGLSLIIILTGLAYLNS